MPEEPIITLVNFNYALVKYFELQFCGVIISLTMMMKMGLVVVTAGVD